MAVVDGTNIPPPSPRRRGGLPVTVSGYRGKIVVRKRQGRKGPRKSPLQQAWVDNFSCIAYWSKWADPRAREWAEEMAPDTGWYWRDIVETGMSGKLLRLEGEEPITTPTVSLQRSTAQAVGTGAITLLTPDTLLWDNNYFWNPIANQSRITFRSPGLYLFGMQTFWPVNTTSRRTALIRNQDGTTLAETSAGEGTSAPGRRQAIGCYYFHAQDYIECYGHSSAASQTAQLLYFWAVAITPEALLGS